MTYIVKKFGGTSVGSVARVKQLPSLVEEQNNKVIIVVSAFSGTTNILYQLSDLIENKNTDFNSLYNHLFDKYKTIISELFDNKAWHEKTMKLVDNEFLIIKQLFTIPVANYKNILIAKGEWLSSQIIYNYFLSQGISIKLIEITNHLVINEHGVPDELLLSQKLNAELNNSAEKLYITQGFVCSTTQGEVSNLKRGGSDFTASLIAAAIDAQICQIYTDIDGMHNNDPRVVSKTKSIPHISFDEASELAYFGAKILHPTTIKPCSKKNIPVQLLNTFNPKAIGTTISHKTELGKIKAVAAKDGITIVHIKSEKMLMAYGFLAQIFNLFAKYKIAIDIVTTSEVAVSITIDNTGGLNELLIELQQFAEVQLINENSIICIVGQAIGLQNGIANKILSTFVDIPITLVSIGASANNVSIVIPSEYKKQALQNINDHFFFNE